MLIATIKHHLQGNQTKTDWEAYQVQSRSLEEINIFNEIKIAKFLSSSYLSVSWLFKDSGGCSYQAMGEMIKKNHSNRLLKFDTMRHQNDYHFMSTLNTPSYTKIKIILIFFLL